MESKEDLKSMTNEELLERWVKGCSWVDRHMIITGTNKNQLGEFYDRVSFTIGLNRLKSIERELQERNVKYGKE